MKKKKWSIPILKEFLVSPLLSPKKIKKKSGIDVVINSLYNISCGVKMGYRKHTPQGEKDKEVRYG